MADSRTAVIVGAGQAGRWLVMTLRSEGFEGRIVTMGEPEIPPGDIRLEWADGGIVRSQSRIEQAVAQALGQA